MEKGGVNALAEDSRPSSSRMEDPLLVFVGDS